MTYDVLHFYEKYICMAPCGCHTNVFFINYLPTGEYSFALLGVSGNTLFGIFALEAELLQLALDSQGLGEWDLGSRLHSALDAPDGLRGAIGWAE